MNRFRKELFDKDEKVYLYKRNTESKYNELNIKKILKSEENINLLVSIMSQEIDLYEDDGRIKKKIIQFLDSWINLGKFDNNQVLNEMADKNIVVAVDFLNQEFIDTFKSEFYMIKNFYQEDINPFKIPKEGKLHKDMYVDDYRSLQVQSYQTLYNQHNYSYMRDNSIPHYQNLSKGRNYDREEISGLNSTGYDKENKVYSRYGNKSFKELLKYDDHNDVFQHLPWQESEDLY